MTSDAGSNYSPSRRETWPRSRRGVVVRVRIQRCWRLRRSRVPQPASTVDKNGKSRRTEALLPGSAFVGNRRKNVFPQWARGLASCKVLASDDALGNFT